MDADEWQVLDLYGAFLFVVEFVPRAWFDAQRQPIELIGSEKPNDGRLWWRNCQPALSITRYLDQRLLRADTWPYEQKLTQTSWSEGDFHRIDLWESDEEKVMYLQASLDARYECARFLSRIAELALASDCVLFIESEQSFLEPSEVDIFTAMNRSSAARLVREDVLIPKGH
jgi:hypothetical protein